MSIKKSSLLLILFYFICLSADAQARKYSKFNKKVREESYSSAIVYANDQLESLHKKRSNYKFLKGSLPYYIGLGRVYRNMGDYSAAEKLYLEAQTLAQQRQSNKAEKKLGRSDLDLRDALADMQLELGNYKSAGELLERSIQERKETMWKTNLQRYRPYLFYAKYLMAIGKNDEAFNYLRDYILFIRNTYHNSYEDLDRFAEAYETLARLELERGNLEEATLLSAKNLKYQQHKWVRQRAGKNNLNRIESYNLMAHCYLGQTQYERAIDLSDRAMSLYNSAVGKPTIYKVPVLMTRAEILWGQKEFEKAFQLFKEADRIQIEFANQNFGRLSEYEKENFSARLKKNTKVFFAFAAEILPLSTTFHDDLLSEVFGVQLNSKAKILDESNRLRSAIASSDNRELQQLYADCATLKNEYARTLTTGNTRSSAVTELERKIDNTEKRLNELASGLIEPGVIHTPGQIAARLGDDEVAIEIIRVSKYAAHGSKSTKEDPGYLLLAVTKQRPVPAYHWIANGTNLEGRAYQFYSNTKKNRVDDTLSYGYYFKPIGALARGKSRIYVSPDGIFNLVNLSILGQNDGFVQDDLTIVNVTNTKNIRNERTRPSYATAALFGRPQYNSDIELTAITNYKPDTVTHRAILDLNSEINDLPGTELEVKAIHRLLIENKISTQIKLYDEASEGALKSIDSKDILHIATHGFFLNETTAFNDPMLRSGLLMSGIRGSHEDKREDGILTAYEATLLNLRNTKLVVLSACETGLGDIKNGEGIYGLQRAFEAAGVQNILMSLWKVDDEATMLLMKTFYEELLKTNNAGEALRNAQKLLRLKYRHPYYWGAFKLMGE
jgi:CHAT domain-containing protein